MSNDAALAFDSYPTQDRTVAYCELPELETLRPLIPERDDFLFPLMPLVPEASRRAVPLCGREEGSFHKLGHVVG